MIDTFCPTCETTPPFRTAYDLWEFENHPKEALANFEADTSPF